MSHLNISCYYSCYCYIYVNKKILITNFDIKQNISLYVVDFQFSNNYYVGKDQCLILKNSYIRDKHRKLRKQKLTLEH